MGAGRLTGSRKHGVKGERRCRSVREVCARAAVADVLPGPPTHKNFKKSVEKVCAVGAKQLGICDGLCGFVHDASKGGSADRD